MKPSVWDPVPCRRGAINLSVSLVGTGVIYELQCCGVFGEAASDGRGGEELLSYASQMCVRQSLGVWVKGVFCPSRSRVQPETLHS